MSCNGSHGIRTQPCGRWPSGWPSQGWMPAAHVYVRGLGNRRTGGLGLHLMRCLVLRNFCACLILTCLTLPSSLARSLRYQVAGSRPIHPSDLVFNHIISKPRARAQAQAHHPNKQKIRSAQSQTPGSDSAFIFGWMIPQKTHGPPLYLKLGSDLRARIAGTGVVWSFARFFFCWTGFAVICVSGILVDGQKVDPGLKGGECLLLDGVKHCIVSESLFQIQRLRSLLPSIAALPSLSLC